MAAIDILILIVFVGAVIYGFRRGIIRQLGAFAALFAAVLACRCFGDAATDIMLSLTGGDAEASSEAAATVDYSAGVLGNVALFLMVYVVVKLLAGGLRTVAKALFMGPIDSVLGAVFTILEWMMGLSLALNLWTAIFPESALMKASELGNGLALKSIMDLGPWMLGILKATDLPSVIS